MWENLTLSPKAFNFIDIASLYFYYTWQVWILLKTYKKYLWCKYPCKINTNLVEESCVKDIFLYIPINTKIMQKKLTAIFIFHFPWVREKAKLWEIMHLLIFHLGKHEITFLLILEICKQRLNEFQRNIKVWDYFIVPEWIAGLSF